MFWNIFFVLSFNLSILAIEYFEKIPILKSILTSFEELIY